MPFHIRARFGDHPQCRQAQQIDLHQARILDAVLIPLRHDDPGLLTCSSGTTSASGSYDQHPAHMDGQMPRDADD